ncbi:putative ribonuclease H domain, reverse transcriptase zinc-binding domain-containing protein [Arabidopsis thaliana]
MIAGWQNNFLSPGGKEVLLKAVAMALPTYTMTCFKLPTTICQQLSSVMAEFWWKNKRDSKGMHWKAREHLSKPKSEGGIRFKDIEAFNIALLGKQLWRMVSRKDSLMARVYKSRYFRKTNPLNAPLGSRPSFAWKSIHAAQELLRQGTRAIIDNGASTEIWRHQWIESKPAKAVNVVKRVLPSHARSVSSLQYVRDLLDESGREWRRDLLSALFPEDITKQIIQLRPGGRHTLDRVAWDYSRDGHYSVKSGYWVLMEVVNRRTQTQHVLQPSLNPLYEQIWKAKVSPKVHHFLWRCLSNIISVAGNLYHRHLVRDGSCPRCPSQVESVNHLLFKCSFARLVWAISKIPAPPEREWLDSFYQNLHKLLNITQCHPWLGDDGLVAPWILWRLWKNRNDLVFKGKQFDAPDVIRRAIEDEEEWRLSMQRSFIPKHIEKTEPPAVKWKQPPHGWVKCNSDGTWTADRSTSSIGWVLRNSEKNVLWIGVRAIPRVQSALVAEAEALRWAVLSLSRFSYRKVIFESDSQQLVSLLVDNGDRPALDLIIQDIKHLLQHFEETKFVFTNRGGNGVVDRIAKESLSLENYDPQLYSIMPNWVKSFVEYDKM